LAATPAITSVHAQTTTQADANDPGPVSGTGNMVFTVSETVTPLNPACVVVINSVGNIAASGFIHSNADGKIHAIVMDNSCVTPYQATIYAATTFTNVTIAGRTGSITLVATGTSVGNAANPQGVISYQLSVGNSSGALLGITGQGLATSDTSNTSAYFAYWMQFEFNNTISVLNVSTINSDGGAIIGYYAAIWQNGQQLGSCFSPCSFAINDGQSYTVTVANYQNETFSHWSDGTANMARWGGYQVVHVQGAAQRLALTAVYTR